MNSLSRTQKPRAGFTLLEVMVVIVILGVWQVWWCLTCWATKRKPIGKSHQRYRGAGKRTGYVPTG